MVLSNGVLNFLSSEKEEKTVIVEQIGERLLSLLEEPLQTENSLFVNSMREMEFSEEILGILQ